MNNLEFEVSSASGIKYDTELSAVDKDKLDIDEKSMIEFSAKLVDLFKSMAEEHSESNPNDKVTYKKLKEVYIEAANVYQKSYPSEKNNWCIAKIFLYLDIKMGQKIQINDSYANIDFEDHINVSLEWAPSEENLESADSIIKEKELGYDFASIDNLYLEDYKPLNLKWE
jgi:hypothetical protein